jgi:hypothetical protein
MLGEFSIAELEGRSDKLWKLFVGPHKICGDEEIK